MASKFYLSNGEFVYINSIKCLNELQQLFVIFNKIMELVLIDSERILEILFTPIFSKTNVRGERGNLAEVLLEC